MSAPSLTVQHIRGKVYESKGIRSGVLFFKYECSCGYLTLDVSDLGLAREAFKRHVAAQQAASEAA